MRDTVTVLWWNTTVVALVGGESHTTSIPAGGDLLLAFCGFVEGLAPTPKSIRLIYHAPDLEHFSTPCPKGSRAVIRKALSPRYAALANPTTTWGAHKIRTNDGGSSTLLYIEEQPRLAKLRAALDDRGIALEAVFPVLALVEANPPTDQLDKPKAAIALLHTDDAAAVFWTTPNGDRHAAFFHGDSARDRVINELFTGLSAFDAKVPPAFSVIQLGTKPLSLADHVLPFKPTVTVTVEDFLSNADKLKRSDLANLLPPPSAFSTDTLAYAAALLFFCSALGIGGKYLADIRAIRADLELQRSQEQQLLSSVQHLTENRDRITTIQKVLDEAAPAKPVKARFLDTLGRTRPVPITVRSVSLAENYWTVTAVAHEGVGLEKGPYQSFVDAFAKSSGGWTINPESRSPVIRQTEFTLTGTIP